MVTRLVLPVGEVAQVLPVHLGGAKTVLEVHLAKLWSLPDGCVWCQVTPIGPRQPELGSWAPSSGFPTESLSFRVVGWSTLLDGSSGGQVELPLSMY